MRFPIVPRSNQELASLVSPVSVPQGQSEAIHYPYYDTQTYLAAGSASLTFFQTVQSDLTLSNMEAGGQLPDPKYLELYYISADILLPVTPGDPSLDLRDLVRLVMVGRPVLTLTISDKVYARVPLSFCHTSGGITSPAIGSATAANSQSIGANGPADGGFCVDGSIIIPPKVGFSVVINWGNVLAVQADTRIRVHLDGTVHRRVL